MPKDLLTKAKEDLMKLSTEISSYCTPPSTLRQDYAKALSYVEGITAAMNAMKRKDK